MAELTRIVRPGGHLLVTTHGAALLPSLSSAEVAQFESGRIVIRYGAASGRNLCAAFHPRPAVQELAVGLREVAFLPARIGQQDVYLFSKPAGTSSRSSGPASDV